MISAFKHYKFSVNLLIAMIVFLNAIAPISVVARELSGSDDTTAEALFGDKILICTPTGFKYISIEELNDRQSGGRDQQQSHCPQCLIKVSATVFTTVEFDNSFEIEYRNTTDQVNITKSEQDPISISSASNPRAPPIFL